MTNESNSAGSDGVRESVSYSQVQDEHYTGVILNIRLSLPKRGGPYRAVVGTPAGGYAVDAPNVFAASIREDMRSLRWKAIGLRDPGDKVLVDAGARIGQLLFPDHQKDIWKCIQPGEAKKVTVEFTPGTEELFHVPWELIFVNNAFLLADRGSHLVREWGTGSKAAAERQPLNILYVSFASDVSLDFQTEREVIDKSASINGKISFLANPSERVLRKTLRRLKPNVLHLASHGAYDFLRETHTVDVGNDQSVPLEDLMEVMSEYVPEILVLGICESARLSSGFGSQGLHAKSAKNIIGYSYPVLDETAIEATRVFYDGLANGKRLSQIMADIRGLSLTDPFAFFNLVHYRLSGALDSSWDVVVGPVQNVRKPPPLLIGRDGELGSIDESLLNHTLTTVLGPRAFGGSTLIEAWCWLQGRSPDGPVPYVQESNLEELRKMLEEHAATSGKKLALVVVDDPRGLLTDADLAGLRILRSVEFSEYQPIAGENTILLKELDSDAATALSRRITPKGRAVAPSRGLGLVPGVIRRMAEDSSFDLEAAEKWIDTENRMSARFAVLNEEGKRVGSLLAALGGQAQLDTTGDDVEIAYGMSAEFLSIGVENALEARVIVRTVSGCRLSPDFRLLRRHWFPNFAKENAEVLKSMFRVAMTLMKHEPENERNADFATRVLLTAVELQALDYAMELFVVLVPWYSDRGRLEQLLTIAKLLSKRTEGMESVVTLGTVAKILTEESQFAEALKMHAELETQLKKLRGEEWYEQNLIASLTGQVDCFTNLGMPAEAFEKWKEAAAVAEEWKDRSPDTRPRLLAQLGELHVYRGTIKEAHECLVEAVELAEKTNSASLLAEVLYTQAKILWELEEYDESIGLLKRIRRTIDIENMPRLYPQVLDLEAKLMAEKKNPKAIDFLLESYERDLTASDYRGAAISLLSLIKLHIELDDLGLAQERLNELAKLVRIHNLETERGAVEYYRGIIFREQGDKERARASFLLSEKLDREAGQLRHAAQARAQAEACR